ncbi:MAG: CARDB domain-containing protein [Dehalococcoidia bacterium]
MTDTPGSYPPDEPIIGAATPPPPPRTPNPPPAFGGGTAVAGDDDWDDDDEYYDDEDEEYGEYDEGEYYDDRYYSDVPARQPMFYVFIALAVLVGAAAVFLLYSVVRGDDDDGPGVAATETAKAQVRIDSPRAGDRLDIGRQYDVIVAANASEPITKFQLFIGDQAFQEIGAPQPNAEKVYNASLPIRLEKRGEYSIFVRVTTQSGATKDSDKVRVVGVEDIGTATRDILGKVTAQVTVRRIPADNGESLGTLNSGQTVKVLGKTADSEWLYIDASGGGWVKKAAVDVSESLALVPIRAETPTAVAATATVAAIPSPSPSPTATATNAPDFVPTDALLTDPTHLRVTITNVASNAYSGSLVVSAGTLAGARAFAVNAGANNGTATVTFELASPVTQRTTVEIRVDPDNAVKETNEANNSATFTLQPAVEAPSLSLTAQLAGTNVSVTIANSGGDFASTDARIVLTIDLNGSVTTTETPISLALKKNESRNVSVPRPAGSGQATIRLMVGGQTVASASLTIPPPGPTASPTLPN